MPILYEKAIVAKRNVLNELRSNNMTVQELRFFSIYLSKINPKDKSTRVVRFPLSDFQRIMGFGRLNIKQLQGSTDSLLCKIVHVPNDDGLGWRAFQIFKECHIFQDQYGQWWVEIDAHDRALPLMFDFKSKYFSYELWNALRLKSPNQVRMYEILKQWINKKESCTKEFKVTELRDLLGISPEEYDNRWNNFKVRVLDSCQEALKEYTDICYTYERGKVGRGGKWLSIVFHIKKNKDYIDPLTLDEFIEMQPEPDMIDVTVDEEEIEYGGELANLLGSVACDDEFSPEQIRVLQDLVIKAVPSGDRMDRCDYLIHQVHKMNAYDKDRKKVKNRFNYLRKMVEKDIQAI